VVEKALIFYFANDPRNSTLKIYEEEENPDTDMTLSRVFVVEEMQDENNVSEQTLLDACVQALDDAEQLMATDWQRAFPDGTAPPAVIPCSQKTDSEMAWIYEHGDLID
jgi:hypothetical protein